MWTIKQVITANGRDDCQDLLNIGQMIKVEACDDNDYRALVRLEIARVNREARKEFQAQREDGTFLHNVMNEGQNLPKKVKQMETLRKLCAQLRTRLAGPIIYRTIDSKDWQGRPISGLDKYNESVLMLTPRQEERDALEHGIEELLQDKKVAASTGRESNEVSLIALSSGCVWAFRNRPGCPDTSRASVNC